MIEAIRHKLLEQWDNLWLDLARPDDISVIQRSSTWLHENGKIVFILFRRGDRRPFAVAKTVRNQHFKNSIEREFNNLTFITENANTELKDTFPRPLILDQLNGTTVSFETALTGKSIAQIINNHGRFGKKQKISYFFKLVTEWLKHFYLGVDSKNLFWEAHQVEAVVSETVNKFTESLELTSNEKKMIQTITDRIEAMKDQRLPVLCQHGDFGGGAILVERESIGVIDWEFFEQQSLPLFDLFKLIIHPGFSLVGSSSYGLMDQFKALFELEWYSKLALGCCAELCNTFKMNSEIINLLFAIFLIQLINTHDGLHKNITVQNGWRDIFQYYADICFQKKHTTAPWLILRT